MSVTNNSSAMPSPRPQMASASAAPVGLTGADLLRILRQRWLLITVILMFFAITFTVGAVLWRSFLPKYSAMAATIVTMPERSALRTTSPFTNSDVLDRHKKTVAGKIKTQKVILDALSDPELKRTPWYLSVSEGDPELKGAISDLTDRIAIGLQPNDNYITIGMSMYCADEDEKVQLATIVNAVARAFIEEVNSDQRDERDREITELQNTLEGLEDDITEARVARDNLLATAEVPAMRKQMDTLSMELDQLLSTIAKLEMAKADIEKNLTGFRTMANQGTVEQNPIIQQALDADPILRSLEANLSSNRSRFEILASKFGPDHIERRALEISVQGLQNEIAKRRKEVIEINSASALASLQQEELKLSQQLVESTQKQELLHSRRRDLNKTLLDVERYETRMDELARQRVEISDKVRDLLLVRDNDLPAKIYSRAMVPLEPIGPSIAAWVPMGILLGLAVGVGLAMLIELSDSSVKTPTDITAKIGMPLLAMLPDEEDLDEDVADYRLVCRQLEHTTVNESFRQLRSNLEFSGPLETRRSLLVTSPSPLDGRTTVAVNMALTIARTGRRVLLVDANFRRPEVAGLFKIDASRGLSDVLSGQAQWSDCIVETDEPNLSVLPSGKLPPNPNELLSSQLGQDVYAAMAENYDQVIYDGPPATLLTDAWVLANRLDGVVLVVRAGENTLGIVHRSRSLLEKSGANILGCVLNGVQATSGGYLQKNYEAFSEYHSGSAVS